MSNPNGRKGSAFERLIADYLAQHVDDRIDRRVKTGNKDRGDIGGLRGKSATYKVEPLPDAPTVDPQVAALRAEWTKATPERRAKIEAEVAALTGGAS